MRTIDVVAGILVIVGALNWGLVGVLRFDLVAALFGGTILSSIVYTLVGISGIFLLTQSMSLTRRWCAAPAR